MRAARERAFVNFHVLGILDFVVAATAGMLSSGAFPAIHDGPPTSAPMEVWPLILFPGPLVPLFIFLRLAALLQVRARRAGPRPRGLSAPRRAASIDHRRIWTHLTAGVPLT